MNTTWSSLPEYESKDLVKRFFNARHGLELNTTKAYQITSAFIQAREYFEASKKAGTAVSPLLLYYGVVSLSRGLILFLDPMKREDTLKGSHGLNFQNWTEIASSGEFKKLTLTSSAGTFSELLKVTKNVNFYRLQTNKVDGILMFELPPDGFSITLQQILFGIPSLLGLIESWLNEPIACLRVANFDVKENSDCSLIFYNVDNDLLQQVFVTEFDTEVNGMKTTVSSENFVPRLVSNREVNFAGIGSLYATVPICSSHAMNDISNLYAASYTLGIMCRYYPSVWNNINKGIKDDSIYPLFLNLHSTIEQYFPEMALEFLHKSI